MTSEATTTFEATRPLALPEDRLYLVTHKQLPWSVRVVQVAHAATALVLKRQQLLTPVWGSYGPAVVAYAVADQPTLAQLLAEVGPEAEPFYEPDLGEALTAFAYYGQPLAAFTGLKLL